MSEGTSMTWIEVDLTTAVFPSFGAGGAISGTSIVSASPGDPVEFVIPGLVVDPAKWYQFEFTFGDYDANGDWPYASISTATTDNGSATTAYPYLGDCYLLEDDADGFGRALKAVMGPGLRDWDAYVPTPQFLWFFIEEDQILLSVRYRTGTVGDFGDFHDDGPLSWVNKAQFLTPSRHYWFIGDNGPGPGGATMERCWAGTPGAGISQSGTNDGGFGGTQGSGAGSFVADPDSFGCQWYQSWLTLKMTASDTTVFFVNFPEYSNGDLDAADIQWEPSSTPVERRLNFTLNLLDPGPWRFKAHAMTYGDPLYDPGFSSQADLNALPDIHVEEFPGLGPGDPIVVKHVYIPGDVLDDYGFGLTGGQEIAVTATDPYTSLDESWSYGSGRRRMNFTAIPEKAYQPRYQLKLFTPDADEVIDGQIDSSRVRPYFG